MKDKNEGGLTARLLIGGLTMSFSSVALYGAVEYVSTRRFTAVVGLFTVLIIALAALLGAFAVLILKGNEK